MTNPSALPTTTYQIADTQPLNAITAKLNKHLRNQRLHRVELRHTTSSRFDPGAVRAAISGLLRQQGLGQVQVSVRAIENPLDNAAGQHLLSLFEAPKPPGLLERLPGKLMALFAGGSKPTASARQDPPLHQKTATLTTQKAIAVLKSASQLAYAAYRKQHGNTPPAAVGVVVRDGGLHAALAPLIEHQAQAASDWFARELQPGTPAAPGHWKVTYHYEAPPADDDSGTAVMGGSDIEISLTATPQNDTCADLCSTAMPSFTSTAMPDGASADTAMPSFDRYTPRWQLRVLGTFSHQAGLRAYSQPLLVNLPSQINRSTLKAAGLERLDANVLAVCSEKHPLLCQQSPQGLSVTVPQRHAPDGQAQPLYYTYPEGLPLGAIQLTPALAVTRPLRLLVNSPSGAVHPQTGQALPALVLEIGLYS
jgi:hypothetical protein